MQDLPHRYSVTAAARPDGDVVLDANRLSPLFSAPPAEFGGPGDRWSPETLLTAAVADCFVLTFRAIARVTPLPWVDITCETNGTLDRMGRVTRFTDISLHAHLRIPEGTSEERARQVLARAKEKCLVSNSLIAAGHLEADVEVVPKREDADAAKSETTRIGAA